ncbi:MAG: hypothetical protein KGH62_01125, partial [Candidatus Micrarchaeota archaeon]|nr:hypothetical protein [Candidatus Micrarchaeota archaeon]
MKNDQIRHMVARLSLAVVFVGIGIWEIAQPSYWAMYVPGFVSALIRTNTFVMLHGITLLVIGLAVVLGAYLRIASGLAVLIMLSIVVDLTVTFGFDDIVIRDLGILLIALALFFDDTNYMRL